MKARLLASVTAAMMIIGACGATCYAQGGPVYMNNVWNVNLPAPGVAWNDIHFFSPWTWWRHETHFVLDNPIVGSNIPLTNKELHYNGNPFWSGEVRADTIVNQSGTTGISMNIPIISFGNWKECTYYYTINNHPVTFDASVVPVLFTGVITAQADAHVRISAASQSGASISQILYASSMSLYNTPSELENSGLLHPVTPITTVIQTTETEIYATAATADYSYSKTIFDDGSIYYGASDIVPSPSGIALLGLGGLMVARRRR